MDISLLKPLSEILDVSVIELLNGKKTEKIDNNIINDTITTSTKIYIKREKNKIIKRMLIIIFIFIILLLTLLTIISEINYGVVSFGEKASIDFPNISSINLKRQTDKCMDLILHKDINNLSKLVISNKNYLLYEESSNFQISDERLKKLSRETHSKSYIDNLNQFYRDINVKKYKYNFFYYNGRGYVFDYSLEIEYSNKNYILDIQVLDYKDNVEFVSWGFWDVILKSIVIYITCFIQSLVGKIK